MAKRFITEIEIEALSNRAEKTLTIDAQTVITDLAYERARVLGITLSWAGEKPPSAPERPYISNETYFGGVVSSLAGQPKQDNPVKVNSGDVRTELLAVNNELFAAGLITSTGGNISVRIPGKPDQLWITPGSIYKGNLRTDMMVRIDLNGTVLDRDAYPASSERFVHTEIMHRRPEVNAVVHTHADMATILVLTGSPFLPISIESAFIGEIPRVPFIKPGTQDLAKAVGDAMMNSCAVLMQNHGLVVAGKSLRSAADTTLVIEQTARRILGCRLLGKEPPILPKELAEEYRKIGEMRA